MQAALGRRAFAGQWSKRVDDGGVTALDEQALSGVADPGVCMEQMRNEVGTCGRGQFWRRLGRGGVGEDAVDSAAVVAGANVDLGHPAIGNPLGVLDVLAI